MEYSSDNVWGGENLQFPREEPSTLDCLYNAFRDLPNAVFVMKGRGSDML